MRLPRIGSDLSEKCDMQALKTRSPLRQRACADKLLAPTTRIWTRSASPLLDLEYAKAARIAESMVVH
jgi:hypothetical protein